MKKYKIGDKVRSTNNDPVTKGHTLILLRKNGSSWRADSEDGNIMAWLEEDEMEHVVIENNESHITAVKTVITGIYAYWPDEDIAPNVEAMENLLTYLKNK